MPNHSSTPAQLSSIPKLNRDILWDIFSINAPNHWEPSFYEASNVLPLTTLRQTSQVCSLWRKILLESPSLWGRSINLDALHQRSGAWRDIILQRTGQSLLSMTGVKEVKPGSGLSIFIVELLDNHWNRIQKISLMTTAGVLDWNNIRVWEAFGRPAENLMICTILSDNPFPPRSPIPLIRLQPNFRLFSDHAPSLSLLSLPDKHMFLQLDIKSPILRSGNLRHLYLCYQSEVNATDILTACSWMPLLETLSLEISNLKTIHSTESNSIRPHMPRLDRMQISSPTLDIYPALLDHITASARCALRVNHELLAGIREPTIEEVECMHRVLLRYGNTFFEEQERQSSVVDVELMITSALFRFSCSRRLLHIQVRNLDAQFTQPVIILPGLVDTIAAFNYCNTIRKLTFDPAHGIFSRTSSHFRKLFKSMHSVKTLATFPSDLSVILELSDEMLFPHLKTVLPWGDFGKGMINHIVAFIAERHRARAPIDVLDLRRYEEWVVAVDLRSLEQFAGLKVVWRYRDGIRNEYICGSRDAKRLFFYEEGDSE